MTDTQNIPDQQTARLTPFRRFPTGHLRNIPTCLSMRVPATGIAAQHSVIIILVKHDSVLQQYQQNSDKIDREVTVTKQIITE